MAMLKFCKHTGCRNLVKNGYCELHKEDAIAEEEARKRRKDGHRRGSAYQRGYNERWRKYSKWYLNQPEHTFCALHLEGCTLYAQCVDHVIPPKDANDPLFWDTRNHQPACIHCNSVKGATSVRGTFSIEEALNGQGQETDTSTSIR